jgi:hypothetical protein
MGEAVKSRRLVRPILGGFERRIEARGAASIGDAQTTDHALEGVVDRMRRELQPRGDLL